MSSQEMDWSPEYCLACDRQTDGKAYCSEACRLAEYERANSTSGSEASSPAQSTTHTSWPKTTSANVTNFYLPSAYDFSKKSTTTSRPQTQPTYGARPQLTPSASQSSLSSMQSQASYSSESSTLSEESKQALRAYASSFDQSRYHRRQSAY